MKHLKVKLLATCVSIFLISGLFTSCPIPVEKVAQSEIEFLYQTYPGNFIELGSVSIPVAYKNVYEINSHTYKRFYSTALNKNIIVSTAKFVENEYASNYLFVKNRAKIEKKLAEDFKDDFSDVRAIFDEQWTFSGWTEYEFEDSYYLNCPSPIYYLIHLKTDENDVSGELEQRLKSVCYKLYLGGASDYEKYFFITEDPTVDFSTIDYTEISTNVSLKNKFQYLYATNKNSCKLIKITK